MSDCCISAVVAEQKINAQLKFTVKTESRTVELDVTENGTYTVLPGIDGFNPVVVNVPNPSSGTIEITENGSYDVTEKASAIVNVPSFDPYTVFNKDISRELSFVKTSANLSVSRYRFADYTKLQFYSSWLAASGFGSYCFYGCSELKIAVAKSIATGGGNAPGLFQNCRKLKTFVFDTTAVLPLPGSYTFLNTPIESGDGRIYVRDTLVDAYKDYTAWVAFADIIYGYGDAPEYDSSVSYSIGDVCQYAGKFYAYAYEPLTASVGNAPSGTAADTEYWEYVNEVGV